MMQATALKKQWAWETTTAPRLPQPAPARFEGQRLHAATGSRDEHMALAQPHTTEDLLSLLARLDAMGHYDAGELREYLWRRMDGVESFAEWCALRRALVGSLGCVPRRFVVALPEDALEQLTMRGGRSASEWGALAAEVRGRSAPDVEKIERLVGEGMEEARGEVEGLLCGLLGDAAYPEPAREVMLALMDFEVTISPQLGQAAMRWLTHKDRSIFTIALKVALSGAADAAERWAALRPLLSEDRQRIGDKIAERS